MPRFPLFSALFNLPVPCSSAFDLYGITAWQKLSGVPHPILNPAYTLVRIESLPPGGVWAMFKRGELVMPRKITTHYVVVKHRSSQADHVTFIDGSGRPVEDFGLIIWGSYADVMQMAQMGGNRLITFV